ncbi:HDOD domain-containing protein [Psychromonas sp. MME1]|uniref:HDOD domain-containing protein n=2 Tax=unclassified Psychromonas TaxID=2614957 RepID=UPI0034E2C241
MNKEHDQFMTANRSQKEEHTLAESIDILFLRFLVGKNKIANEESYNDGLSESELDEQCTPGAADGWNKRILLDVEKQRVKRVEADKAIKEKRNAVLMHLFQKTLLTAIQNRLSHHDEVITHQLQLRESTLELLKKLLSSEPRYSILASLLELNISTRNHLISLVCSSDFMESLGRDARNVRDIQAAIGLIGIDVLRYLIPAIIFKYTISNNGLHNVLFTKKLWRYELTLGQACTALMKESDYRRPHEGMLLSAMVNFAYVAAYKQYQISFETVRVACLDQARDKGEKEQHDFFFDLQTDPATLQQLLVSQAKLALSLSLSETLFSKDFPHLVNALREQVECVEFTEMSSVGKILFKALRFAKYDQLRTVRLFKAEWLDDYLQASHISSDTYKNLVRQELFRFKTNWS